MKKQLLMARQKAFSAENIHKKNAPQKENLKINQSNRRQHLRSAPLRSLRFRAAELEASPCSVQPGKLTEVSHAPAKT